MKRRGKIRLMNFMWCQTISRSINSCLDLIIFPLSLLLALVSDVIALVFVLQVKKRNSEESSTQWTTGIAEVQLPIE